jgi:hypothetical protein
MPWPAPERRLPEAVARIGIPVEWPDESAFRDPVVDAEVPQLPDDPPLVIRVQEERAHAVAPIGGVVIDLPEGAPVHPVQRIGQVVDHRDYWNQVERRERPYDGW